MKQIKKSTRQYVFRSSPECHLKCSYCYALGMKSQGEKTLSSLKKGITKAQFGRNHNFIFPCNTVFSEKLNDILKLSVGQKKSWLLHCQYPTDTWEKVLGLSLDDPIYIWLDDWNNEINTKLQNIITQNRSYKIILPLIPQVNIKLLLQELKRYKISNEDIMSYAPINWSNDSRLFTPTQIHRLMNRVTQSHPSFRFQTMLGWDTYNSSIPDHLEVDAIYKPSFRKTSPSPEKIKISVIIPTYNNKNYLSNVISHLCQQDYPKEQYELIIVDDGSTDNTLTTIQNQLKNEDVYHKYIFFPRGEKREMGDNQYRAGLARNLGMQNASGSIYSFLDSDILVPSHYLSTVDKQLESFDVLQTRRFDLIESSSYRWTQYSQLSLKEDTSVNLMGYWEIFNLKTQDWQALQNHWKYVCTHSLSLKASLIDQAGWFRRNYNFYGYEDVELGHQLSTLGAHFHLLDIPTYHLFHQTTRSEFQNSSLKRNLVLSYSSAIFFYNTLSNEAYKHIRPHQKMGNKFYNSRFSKLIRRIFDSYLSWCTKRKHINK